MGILPVVVAIIAVVLAGLGNLCFIVWGYSKLTSKVDTLVTQQIADATLREKIRQECNAKHDHHYAHEGNTGIHQEAMSEKMAQLHFDTNANQVKALMDMFKQHTLDDMEVLKEIRDQIKELFDKSRKL